jgi:hypothetical protein
VFLNPVERRERELPRAYFDWYLEKIKEAANAAPMNSLVTVLANCEPSVDTAIEMHVGAGADLDVQEVNLINLSSL